MHLTAQNQTKNKVPVLHYMPLKFSAFQKNKLHALRLKIMTIIWLTLQSTDYQKSKAKRSEDHLEQPDCPSESVRVIWTPFCFVFQTHGYKLSYVAAPWCRQKCAELSDVLLLCYCWCFSFPLLWKRTEDIVGKGLLCGGVKQNVDIIHYSVQLLSVVFTCISLFFKTDETDKLNTAFYFTWF